MTSVRKGQAPGKLGGNEFHLVFSRSFMDPAFGKVAGDLVAVKEIAWNNDSESHKAPVTKKAGPGFAEPEYELSIEWSEARERLIAAEAVQKDPATRSRVLVINGAARNDCTCPGEISKTYRITELAREVLDADGIEADILELSTFLEQSARSQIAVRPPSTASWWPVTNDAWSRSSPVSGLTIGHLVF